MQDLTAIAQNLQGIAAAFKDGGLFFLIGVICFLAYLIIMAAIKRHRKASQEINLNLGQPPDKAGSTSGPCPLHSGIEAQIKSLEDFRKENREDHAKMFDQIKSLSIDIGPGGRKF